ncbi:hypothetical protein U9M48_002356 [Paspalum notatum var. saurae]|uniref:Uncharacterized protein n=1 Tax=Paspalum notatum var. saurae TaxID=547442 RepID=A0AAQ3PNV2_PASNO
MGLSSLCTRDSELWLTMTPMVYDYMVEPHYPGRVMRQFGFARPWPVPRGEPRVPAHIHRMSRSGLPFSSAWVIKLAPWIHGWAEAAQQVVYPVGPHTDASFSAYLAWSHMKQVHMRACRLVDTDASGYIMRLDARTTMTDIEHREA